MSLFKLAVYGGIGYMIYQNFFADQPGGGMSRGGGSRQQSGRQGQRRQQGGGQRSGGQQMSGRGQGMRVTTQEPSGESTSHQVGRGVV